MESVRKTVTHLLLWNDGCKGVCSFPWAMNSPDRSGQGLGMSTYAQYGLPSTPYDILQLIPQMGMRNSVYRAFKIFKTQFRESKVEIKLYGPSKIPKAGLAQGFLTKLHLGNSWFPKGPKIAYGVCVQRAFGCQVSFKERLPKGYEPL